MDNFTTKKGTKLPLLNLRGKSYLQVAFRLVWMREEHPEWCIETEYLEISPEHSIAKATIKDSAGRILATAHKQESKKTFASHAEKAESGAIGRALAMCGYGTQFAPELEEEEDGIVDSPVTRQPAQRPPPQKMTGVGARPPTGPRIVPEAVEGDRLPEHPAFKDMNIAGKTINEVWTDRTEAACIAADYIEEALKSKKNVPIVWKNFVEFGKVRGFYGSN